MIGIIKHIGGKTMHTFTEKHTPAYIVKVFPKASDLFKVHGINFCCKGDIVLKDTFAEKSLTGEEVLEQLNTSFKSWKEKGNTATNWEAMSVAELVEYIKVHYHTFLQEELSALGEFVTRIYRVHGHDSPHLEQLYTLYNEFVMEAEIHLMQEVTEFIPLIQLQEGTNGETVQKEVHKLKERNVEMNELLKKMRKVTNNFVPPLHACGSYRITYARLNDLETKMMDYMHVENNILFKKLTT